MNSAECLAREVFARHLSIGVRMDGVFPLSLAKLANQGLFAGFIQNESHIVAPKVGTFSDIFLDFHEEIAQLLVND